MTDFGMTGLGTLRKHVSCQGRAEHPRNSFFISSFIPTFALIVERSFRQAKLRAMNYPQANIRQNYWEFREDREFLSDNEFPWNTTDPDETLSRFVARTRCARTRSYWGLVRLFIAC
jgi:hypothetical protein